MIKINYLKKNNNKKRIFYNFISLGFLRFFQEFLPLIIIPYLVKTIGLEKYGLIGYALSLATYFGSMVEYGFNVTATRDVSRNRDSNKNLSEIFSKFFFTSLFLGVLVFITFSSIILIFPQFNKFILLYLTTILFVVFKSLVPLWFFHGIEKIIFSTVIGGSMNLIILISIFYLINNPDDYYLFPLLNLLGAFMAFLASIIIIKFKFKIKIKLINWLLIKETLVDGRHVFLKQISTNLYNSVGNVIILGLAYPANPSVTGIYILASKVVGTGVTLANLLSSSFLPYLARNINKHFIFQKIMFVLGSISMIIFISFSDIIADFLLSDNSLNLSLYVKLLSISIIFCFLNHTYGTNYLVLIGKENIFKNITLIISIITFLISLFIIPIYGILGAISIPLIARFAITIFTYKYYLKYKLLNKNNFSS